MLAEKAPQNQPNSAAVLNQMVANFGVLNVKLHQYHWYVQGQHFYTLHEKFEELYHEVNQYFDEFAERLLSIGEKPYSTLAEFLEHASISEQPYETKLTDVQMVENVVKDYRHMREVAARGIELAGKEGDHVTEDLLIGYQASVDKTIWMLQAYLGKDALDES